METSAIFMIIAMGVGAGIGASGFATVVPAKASQPSQPTSQPLFNWSQPPVQCIEDVRYNFDPDDLKQASAYISQNAAAHSRLDPDDEYSRDQDLLNGYKNLDEKINLIYKAANRYDMPPQFLLGVIMMESSLVDDGIDIDGGNYSCGISQLDLGEWCSWTQSLDPATAKKIGWPVKHLRKFAKKILGTETPAHDLCDDDIMDTSTIAVIMSHLQNKFPDSELHEIDPRLSRFVSKKEIEKEISEKLPVQSRSPLLVHLRYEAAQAFLNHCTDHHLAVDALAFVLRDIYDNAIPQELKKSQSYSGDEKFNKRCAYPVLTKSHPVSSAWLLTSAFYNGGPPILEGVTKMKDKPWSELEPDDLARTLRLIAHSHQFFGKTQYDWQVVNHYVRSVINHAAPSESPLIDDSETP